MDLHYRDGFEESYSCKLDVECMWEREIEGDREGDRGWGGRKETNDVLFFCLLILFFHRRVHFKLGMIGRRTGTCC